MKRGEVNSPRVLIENRLQSILNAISRIFTLFCEFLWIFIEKSLDYTRESTRKDTMNQTKFRLCSTVASLIAVLAIAFCELLHPCFHPSESMPAASSELIWSAHHDPRFAAESDSHCPICVGAFWFDAVTSESLVPETVYPAIPIASAQSYQSVPTITVFSRGPPCGNAFSLIRL